jgi:hypothetical protein
MNLIITKQFNAKTKKGQSRIRSRDLHEEWKIKKT